MTGPGIQLLLEVREPLPIVRVLPGERVRGGGIKKSKYISEEESGNKEEVKLRRTFPSMLGAPSSWQGPNAQ